VDALAARNSVKAKLAAGETVYGCFLRYPDPGLAEFLTYQGWDFIVLDGEHGPLEPGSCENLVRAIQMSDVVPLVRVPVNQPHVILRFLDTGAQGCHVPHVHSGQDADAAVRSVKYHPRGLRGLANTRAAQYGQVGSLGEYVVEANSETLVVVQAESMEAVERISEIAAVPDVDVVFIGPTDLSQSFGVAGDINDGRVRAGMERIAAAVEETDAALGVMVASAAAAADWQKRGARYIAVSLEAIVAPAAEAYLRSARGQREHIERQD